MNAIATLAEAERALLETLTYASIFQYPLTARELSERLHGARLDPREVETVLEASPRLARLFERSGPYIHPRGKAEWIDLRRRREDRTKRALRENRLLLKLICSIPFTRMVALSGSAAHMNMNGGGDIDLFVVTRGPRVWTVAASILLLSKLFRRRKWICFNFLVSDRRMNLGVDDLFSANQLVHLRPLTGRETALRLLESNPATKRHHPNSPPPRPAPVDARPGPGLRGVKRIAEGALGLGMGAVLEKALRFLYRRHLHSKATAWSSPQEVILGEDILKLHTESHKKKVLETFHETLDRNLEKIRDRN